MTPFDDQRTRKLLRPWRRAWEEIATLHEFWTSSAQSKFRHRGDGDRMVLTGIVLTVLSAVALTASIRPSVLPGGFGGCSAAFGGAALALFVARIARGSVYVDWVLSGIFYAVSGIILSLDETFSYPATLPAFFVVFCASAALRAWIGTTASPKHGASWLLCSAIFSLCSAVTIALVWSVAAPEWMIASSQTPALVLAIDTLCLGISVAGYGLSLAERA